MKLKNKGNIETKMGSIHFNGFDEIEIIILFLFQLSN